MPTTFRIDVDLTGLPAVTLQPTVVAGTPPTLDVGSPPSLSWIRTPLTNGPTDAGEVGFTGGTPPRYTSDGTPPQFTMPSLNDIVDAFATALSNAPATWNVDLKIQ